MTHKIKQIPQYVPPSSISQRCKPAEYPNLRPSWSGSNICSFTGQRTFLVFVFLCFCVFAFFKLASCRRCRRSFLPTKGRSLSARVSWPRTSARSARRCGRPCVASTTPSWPSSRRRSCAAPIGRRQQWSSQRHRQHRERPTRMRTRTPWRSRRLTATCSAGHLRT